MNVCVIGTGYVGLVTGVSLAYLGSNVICVDSNAEKIAKLKDGVSPIYEPGIEELIMSGIEAGRLSFSTDLNEAVLSSEVVFIAVGTPPLPDGNPDLSYVKAVAQSIGRAIMSDQKRRQHRVIINKSTVPVGSGNWVEMLVREQVRNLVESAVPGGDHRSGGADVSSSMRKLLDEIMSNFTVASNPEFLREGTAISDTFYPNRIVVGANDERAFDVLRDLYRPLLEQSFTPPRSIAPRAPHLTKVPLVTNDLPSAEMIKYAANAFLATKISFANEIANICEHTGADITNVMRGIGLDHRIGAQFLNAGVGWGGSCFGKDVSALIQIANEYGYRPELLDAATSVNKRQRRMVVQKLQKALKIIKGKTIGLLGLAFKPDTDDVRDAPSFDVAVDLLKMGARVKVYDPVANEAFRTEHPTLDLIYAPTVGDLAAGCDALVVVTEWQEFREVDLSALREVMHGSLLVDGRNIYAADVAAAAGFTYIGIGK